MSTPAGWYPDPVEAGIQRWWDGAQWTEHTAPVGRPPAPGPGGYGPPPTAPYGANPGAYGGPGIYGAGAYGTAGYPYAEPKKNSTVMIVLGYVFALLIAIVGLVLGIILLSRGEKGHGIAIVAISIANGLLYLLITLNG